MTELNEKSLMKGRVGLLFTAPWCGPCKIVKPIIDSFAKSQKQIKIYTVNVDEQQGIASQYGVKSVPTFIALSDSNVVNILQGQEINPNNIKNSYV